MVADIYTILYVTYYIYIVYISSRADYNISLATAAVDVRVIYCCRRACYIWVRVIYGVIVCFFCSLLHIWSASSPRKKSVPSVTADNPSPDYHSINPIV